MSKNKNVQPVLDYQTEMKMLSYSVTLKDQEIKDLKQRLNESCKTLITHEKEKLELKEAFLQSFKTEKTFKQVQDSLFEANKEIEMLKEEQEEKDKLHHNEILIINKKYETEINKLKQTLDSHQKKIEDVNSCHIRLEKQDEQIKRLEAEKEKLRIDADEKMINKDVKNQMKFSELKRKMIDNIQNTQKNVSKMNLEYMDASTKLTVLQNHQLLIELEYQSQQIENLLKNKESLEKKVMDLIKEIEVHKEVEKALASKNKKYEKKDKEQNVETLIDKSQSNKEIFYKNFSIMRDISVTSNLEKKVLKLESILKNKSEEYQKLKGNFKYLEDKLKNYQLKYSGIYNLFEVGLKRLSEDEELFLGGDININLENLKKGDFVSLTNKEKCSVIIIFMKHLITLINPTVFKQSEKGFNGSFNNVNIKYHISKNYSEDPMLKKVIDNKNNMLYSIRRSLDNLPSINAKNTSKSFNI